MFGDSPDDCCILLASLWTQEKVDATRCSFRAVLVVTGTRIACAVRNEQPSSCGQFPESLFEINCHLHRQGGAVPVSWRPTPDLGDGEGDGSDRDRDNNNFLDSGP